MDQNEHSASPTRADGGYRLRDQIGQNHLTGLIAVLVGLSQLSVAIRFADHDIILFVVGAGGFLLIDIGISIFRGRKAFEIDWTESDRVTWMITVMQFILSLGVAVAAMLIIFA